MKVCFFLVLYLKVNPDCVQSASVDEFEHHANWKGRNPETFQVFLKMDKMDDIEVVEPGG